MNSAMPPVYLKVWVLASPVLASDGRSSVRVISMPLLRKASWRRRLARVS